MANLFDEVPDGGMDEYYRDNSINHNARYTEYMLFIPDYIYKAINTSNITLDQYIDTVKALKASKGFNLYHLGDDIDNIPIDMREYIMLLEKYNKDIYKTIGSELENLISIHNYIMKELKIPYNEKLYVEDIFIRGLDKYNRNRYSSDYNPINLLKTNKSVEFKDTYTIVNSDICLVIVKDGFGNYITDNNYKKILIDDILNSRELYMGTTVFNSGFMISSIELNLSNS